MPKASKRMRALREQATEAELTVEEAISKVKARATAKFDETVEVSIKLGIDARKSDQAVRGVAAMPAGTGKAVRVAVACEGDKAKDAKEAGADLIGGDDLLDSIGKGELDFDVLIAEPGIMGRLSKHGKLLGPKGLMPNPKSGTVTADVTAAVKQAKAGQVTYRAERAGIVHAAIGKASFSEADLSSNFHALLDSIKKAKPASAKGQYLVSAHMASSMGPAVSLNMGPLR
jgi:large subunit ribosomal protein L1